MIDATEKNNEAIGIEGKQADRPKKHVLLFIIVFHILSELPS